MEKTPLVSIRCTVYNHEAFLRQCLDGFVMQKTTFPFEAIVHDDASTDGSADIIREYAEKYPQIIKPIYETENQWAKGTISKNMDAVMHPASKYIAHCEGDDYWIDPQKLQIQVDFLESHPDYSMCFHRAKTVLNDTDEETDYYPSESFRSVQNRDYTSTELLQVWTVPTASMVYKRECRSFPLTFRYRILYGDIVMVLSCAEMGKVRGLDRTMSVYRIHESSILHSSENEHRFLMNSPEHFLFIKDNFRVESKAINYLISKRFWERSKCQDNALEKAKDFCKSFYFDFHTSLYRLSVEYFPYVYSCLKGLKKKI